MAIKVHFDDFIEDLRNTHGENLRSVILYGSAATGDFVPFESNYNLLIALEKIAPEDLRNAHSAIREWVKLGHPVPVYFTVGEIVGAGDVFPIELHNMERARKVLYGEDVLAHVEISDANLRHQIEYELRSHLLRLRRKYIEVSTSAERLAHLMADSISSFASDFRAVLLYMGEEPPLRKSEILEAVRKSLGVEGNSFEKVLAIRENRSQAPSSVVAANELFGEYLQDIEAVISAVNVLDRKR